MNDRPFSFILLSFISTLALSYLILVEQVETYAQMLSETCPGKVKQLIHEHENFVKKLGKDWDTHISRAAQNIMAAHKYNASNVPNYVVSEELMHAGVSMNLINAPCMKTLVVDKMASLPRLAAKPWNEEEEKLFEEAVKGLHGWGGDWTFVARDIPKRTKSKHTIMNYE